MLQPPFKRSKVAQALLPVRSIAKQNLSAEATDSRARSFVFVFSFPRDWTHNPRNEKKGRGQTMNTYNVTLKFEDRKVGTEGRTIKIDASSIAGAIGKATREFVKSLDRKQRFDMNKGLKIEALRVTTDNPGEPEATAEASA